MNEAEATIEVQAEIIVRLRAEKRAVLQENATLKNALDELRTTAAKVEKAPKVEEE